MSQYQLNQQGEKVAVRLCEHPQEACCQCHFWVDCLPLATFGGKHADKKAKTFLKKRNPNGRLARERARKTA